MLEILFDGLVSVLAAIVVVVTVLPLTRSYRWWIRGWDFPRAQISVLAALVLVLGAWSGGVLGVLVAAAMLACLIYQLFRIVPFLPWSSEDLAIAPEREGDLRLMALNVEMENDRHDDAIAAIRAENPDVLLLMETDATWTEALEPVLERYDTVLRVPKDDHYGMLFATRLKVRAASIERLTRDDTPSVFATLEDRQGGVFNFIGLHPQPPVPGEDTVERDLQTLYAARFARETDQPDVVMGDFNDAAWSDTAQAFKHVGQYLDVRVGRGLFPSFHARHWWFRCPIDQLYTTEGIVVSRYRLGKYVGSDHFPVIAHIRVDAEESRETLRRKPGLTAKELEDIDTQIEQYRRELEHAHGKTAQADGNGDI